MKIEVKKYKGALILIFLIGIVFFVVLFFFAGSRKSQAAETPHRFERIFYISNTYLADGIQSFQQNAASIDVVAPQTYTIAANLEATGSVPIQIQTIAAANDIKVMPLITNQDFSQSLIHTFLTSSTAQQSAISFLIQQALTYKYIGWQFDFEHISSADQDLYSAFVEKAAAALHGQNLVLSVAVVPRTNDDASTDFYKNWSGAFDYSRLASSTDFLTVMTYDDPASTGPTASLPYVQSVLNYLAGKVPADKISLGIPLYYWGWNSLTRTLVRASGSYTRLEYIRAHYKTTEGFNSLYQVPYLVYSVGKYQYMIWYENAQSIQAKLNLMKAYGLRGFSAWVLGVEDPGVWTAVGGYK